MNPWVLVIIIGIIVITIECLSQKSRNNINKKLQEQTNKSEDQEQQEEFTIYPYRKRYVLTKNEYYFYKELQKIAEKYNLIIWTKVRLADIVEVDKSKIKENEYKKYFNKIQSKHIDFVLSDKDSLKLIVALELDDNSHKQKSRYTRDEFLNKTLEVVKIPLIRCEGIGVVEEQLKKIINY